MAPPNLAGITIELRHQIYHTLLSLPHNIVAGFHKNYALRYIQRGSLTSLFYTNQQLREEIQVWIEESSDGVRAELGYENFYYLGILNPNKTTFRVLKPVESYTQVWELLAPQNEIVIEAFGALKRLQSNDYRNRYWHVSSAVLSQTATILRIVVTTSKKIDAGKVWECKFGCVKDFRVVTAAVDKLLHG